MGDGVVLVALPVEADAETFRKNGSASAEESLVAPPCRELTPAASVATSSIPGRPNFRESVEV